jgi:hypothetical protein
MLSRRALPLLILTLAAVLASLSAGGGVWCAFSAKQSNAGNSFAAASDFRAPTSSDREIGKASGGVGGYIRPGGTYNLYAQVADTGSPASGVSTVTANLSSITSGQTAASLSSGSFSFESVSYNRRSSTLTAGSGLSSGTYSYTLTLTDAAGNSKTESGYTVTVDGTAPTASGIQTANKSSIAGRPEQGDTVTFTFSEPPEPNSILSGWSGSSTGITVRIDNNAASSGNDRLQVYNDANSATLPFGSVDLGRTDYVSSSRTFGASGSDSTMVLSGSAITVTLGTQSGSGTTAAGSGALTWSPSTTATDRAGNAMSSTSRTESGTSDKDF